MKKNFLRLLIVAATGFGLACDDRNYERDYRLDTRHWFTIDGDTKCTIMIVKGMNCMYCVSRVRGGDSTSVSCDWSTYTEAPN